MIINELAAHGCAASPSQMGRFETRWLAAEKNRSALADLSGQWIDIVHARLPPRGIMLDMDSSVSPTQIGPSHAAEAAKTGQKSSTPSVRPPIQPETRTICAGSAFIWRISVRAR